MVEASALIGTTWNQTSPDVAFTHVFPIAPALLKARAQVESRVDEIKASVSKGEALAWHMLPTTMSCFSPVQHEHSRSSTTTRGKKKSRLMSGVVGHAKDVPPNAWRFQRANTSKGPMIMAKIKATGRNFSGSGKRSCASQVSRFAAMRP